MKRILLLLAFVLLQGQTDIPIRPPKPPERPHIMEESDVDSLQPTTGVASVVSVAALEGVPADPRAQAAFMRGFRDAFREGDLRTERVAKPGRPARPGPTLHVRFRLAEAEDDKDLRTARAKLVWFAPPPDTVPGRGAAADSLARVYPGLGVSVTVEVREPGTPGREKPPLHHTVSLRLPSGHPVDAPYWQLAGRQVAFIVLEAVHRQDGDLDEDQRVKLEDARRVPPPADAFAPR